MSSRAARFGNRLDSGLLIACVLSSILALLLPGRLRDPLAAGVRRTVLAPWLAVQRRTEAMRAALEARGTALGREAALAERARLAAALERENAALRDLLGLAGRVRTGFVVADAAPPSGILDDHTLTIAAGARAGVVRFAPVVTAEGLVGMVEAVDPAASIAITWGHPDFRVSAVSVDESAFGIVQPHGGPGATRYLLELRGVPFRATLDSGTLIVSSGLGTTFPRGVPIGSVIGELPTTERWARTYLLKPAVLPSSLSSVMVLLPAAPAPQVRTAWTDVQAADSIARAIALASDSARRQAALAELAARRAALDATADSLRTDSVLARLGPAPRVPLPALRPGLPPRLVPPAGGQSDTVRRPPRPSPA